jgi:hypothetical protein
MNLYIQIENENPVNHPAFEDNLMAAFGSIPAHWESFIRVERPTLTVYQVLNNEESTYEKVNGVWTDVWSIRDMTEQEKTAKQQAFKDTWATNPNVANFTAWTFDEATCQYVPPIPKPDGAFKWDGATNSWVALT